MAPAQEVDAFRRLSDAVVGRVNGQAILLSDLGDAALDLDLPLAALTAQGLRGQGFRQAITLLIDETLLVQEATLQEIKIEEEEIARRVDRMIRRLADQIGGDEDLARFLKSRHLDVESLRSLLTKRERRKDQATAIVARRITLGNEDIEGFKRRRQAEGRPYEEVLLAQILIACPAEEQTTSLGAEQYQRALRIAQEAGREPERFGALARENSAEAVERERDGVLGWIDPTKLRQGLRRRVETMRPNEISEPVTTEQGFHILLLLDRRGPRDLLFAEKFEDERARLIESLRAKATIEIYPPSL